MGPDDKEHRLHCDNCFKSKQCVKLNSLKSNEPTPVINCPIIHCKFNCAKVFHACKQIEHESLCPKVKVPCLNSNYGCPIILERWMTAKHLETCPASVVVCTIEHNRWPRVVPPGEARPFFQIPTESKQLDVEFLKRDERTVADWKLLPKKLRNAMKNSLTEVHPSMPLGVSGQRIPKSILIENVKDDDEEHNTVTEETSESEKSEHDDTPWGSKKCPPGLLQSVCNKLATPEQQVNLPSSKESVRDDKQKIAGESTEPSIRLDIIVDVMPRPKLKHRDIYTFLCGREFRRDEYCHHFRDYHGNFLSQLNQQWLFRRCPMANDGCTFGVDRMNPDGNRLIYNETLDSFCVTQIDSADLHDKTGDKEMLSLCDMPFEILVHLTHYLDPLSLNALSMTNFMLREVCESVVVNRGIVVLQWEKSNQGKWEIQARKWLFSTSFSPIRKWSFSQIGTLASHMMSCSHYTRHVADKPFTYNVSLSDL